MFEFITWLWTLKNLHLNDLTYFRFPTGSGASSVFQNFRTSYLGSQLYTCWISVRHELFYFILNFRFLTGRGAISTLKISGLYNQGLNYINAKFQPKMGQFINFALTSGFSPEGLLVRSSNSQDFIIRVETIYVLSFNQI